MAIYQSNLVKKVTAAHASEGNMITPEGLQSIGEGIQGLAKGVAAAKDKVGSAVTGGATDAVKKSTVPTSAEQKGIAKDEVKLKNNPNSFMNMQSSFSNSPFNYNAALVNAVSGAFGGEDLVTPEALQGLTGGLYSGVKAIADQSRKTKDELLKQNVSVNADVSQFNPKEINNLVSLKNEYADVTNKLSKPFVSRKNKQALNAELNKINNNTANYISSVNHIMDLQKSGIENDEVRKGVYNKQENMLWDQIITGGARDMAADNFDITTGKTYFANPHGTQDNPLDVLAWKPMKVTNSNWIKNDTKVFDSIRKYAKDDETPRELVNEQVRNVITSNYNSDPEAIFDSSGIDNFVDSLYGSEDFDSVLAEKFPSEYSEMLELQKGGDVDTAKSLYKQLMRKVDLSNQWLDFRTNSAMEQYDQISSAAQSQKSTAKGRTAAPLSESARGKEKASFGKQ